jgi:hypothetical protein
MCCPVLERRMALFHSLPSMRHSNRPQQPPIVIRCDAVVRTHDNCCNVLVYSDNTGATVVVVVVGSSRIVVAWLVQCHHDHDEWSKLLPVERSSAPAPGRVGWTTVRSTTTRRLSSVRLPLYRWKTCPRCCGGEYRSRCYTRAIAAMVSFAGSPWRNGMAKDIATQDKISLLKISQNDLRYRALLTVKCTTTSNQ